MNDLQILVEARGFLANEKDWWNGRTPRKPNTHCALSALMSVGLTTHATFGAARKLARAMGVDGPADVPDFNDRHTHADVVRAFDVAIRHERIRIQAQAIMRDALTPRRRREPIPIEVIRVQAEAARGHLPSIADAPRLTL